MSGTTSANPPPAPVHSPSAAPAVPSQKCTARKHPAEGARTVAEMEARRAPTCACGAEARAQDCIDCTFADDQRAYPASGASWDGAAPPKAVR